MNTKNRNPRLLLLRFLSVLIGLAPLIMLESSLRFFNIPDTPAAADPLADLHQLQPLFVESHKNKKWEIPESRYNFFRPESFDAKKPASEFRVFVLGGSTVQGRPYAVETSFTTWLELALNATDTSRHWNIINCGGISYASYRLAPILDEVLNYSPDLIILYTGHNEFLEERTYGHLKPIPVGIARVADSISSLHTTRLLRSLFEDDDQTKSDSDKWVPAAEVKTRLDIAGGLASFHRDDVWRASVITHFETTLQRMLARCRSVGVPVVVCVPASNIVDTPPFKIELPPDVDPPTAEALQKLWLKVVDQNESNQQRLAACDQILAIDDRHAGAFFVRGRIQLEHRKIVDARDSLIAARDWDVCPLRAPSEIEATVRRLAQDYDLPVLDVGTVLSEYAPDGMLGESVFIDHCHPTIEAHQKIAFRLLEILVQQGISKSSLDQGLIDQSFVTHLSNLGEEYFQRGIQRLKGLQRWTAGRAGELSID